LPCGGHADDLGASILLEMLLNLQHQAQTISTQAIMRLFAGNPRTELAIGTRPCAGLLCAVVRSTNPRWSPQKRPYVVTPKPANGIGRRPDDSSQPRSFRATSLARGRFRVCALLPLVRLYGRRHLESEPRRRRAFFARHPNRLCSCHYGRFLGDPLWPVLGDPQGPTWRARRLLHAVRMRSEGKAKSKDLGPAFRIYGADEARC
jgi:hypothetical protein